jgi:hypothetical protein
MARYKGRHKPVSSGGFAFRFIAFIMGLALSATSLSVAASPAGATGNNGTIKVHALGSESGSESNEPKVCAFNLEFFGFDEGTDGYVEFDVQGGDGPTGVAAGPFAVGTANADGYFESEYFNVEGGPVIANGHYKVTMYGKFNGAPNYEDVKAKSKVFKVDCPSTEEPEYYLETSHETECGAITITLRNVSPWIYPVSYSTDGSTPDANGPNYGPVVDNRGDAPDDQTKSKTLTFTEDQGGGTVTVKYVVAAGTESDLYVGKSVGEVTTVVVDTDCKPEEVQPPTVPVIDECGPGNAVYGEVPPGPWSVTRNPDGSVAITANQGTTFPNGQTTIVLPPPVDSNVPCPTTPPPPPPVVTPPVPPVVVPPVVTPPAKFNPTAKIKSSCVTAQWGEAVAVLNNKKSDEKKARFTIVKPGRDKIVKVKAGDKKRVILTGLRVGSVLKVKVGGEVLDKTRVPKGCEKPEDPNTGFRTIAGKVLDKVAFWKRNTTA